MSKIIYDMMVLLNWHAHSSYAKATNLAAFHVLKYLLHNVVSRFGEYKLIIAFNIKLCDTLYLYCSYEFFNPPSVFRYCPSVARVLVELQATQFQDCSHTWFRCSCLSVWASLVQLQNYHGHVDLCAGSFAENINFWTTEFSPYIQALLELL